MPISVNTTAQESISYLKMVIDVFTIFILGIFLIILYMTYNRNIMYFTISISIYFIILNIYVVLYMNMVKDPVLTSSIHHRIINFVCIYNVFMSIFLIILGIAKGNN